MQKNNLFAMLNEVVKVANDDKNYWTYTGATQEKSNSSNGVGYIMETKYDEECWIKKSFFDLSLRLRGTGDKQKVPVARDFYNL